jgi:hypothetical protein
MHRLGDITTQTIDALLSAGHADAARALQAIGETALNHVNEIGLAQLLGALMVSRAMVHLPQYSPDRAALTQAGQVLS